MYIFEFWVQTITYFDMYCIHCEKKLSSNMYTLGLLVVMGATMGSFFKPEKNLEFFRLKNDPIDGYPGKLE